MNSTFLIFFSLEYERIKVKEICIRHTAMGTL